MAYLEIVDMNIKASSRVIRDGVRKLLVCLTQGSWWVDVVLAVAIFLHLPEDGLVRERKHSTKNKERGGGRPLGVWRRGGFTWA